MNETEHRHSTMQVHVLRASSYSGPSGLDAGIYRAAAAAAAARRHLPVYPCRISPTQLTKTSVPCPQKRPSAASGRLTASSLPLHLAARPAQAKSAG